MNPNVVIPGLKPGNPDLLYIPLIEVIHGTLLRIILTENGLPILIAPPDIYDVFEEPMWDGDTMISIRARDIDKTIGFVTSRDGKPSIFHPSENLESRKKAISDNKTNPGSPNGTSGTPSSTEG